MQLPVSPPPSPLLLSSQILILGGGTWGLSTALHLARRGYTSIHVLDACPPSPSPSSSSSNTFPSPTAAGNDINKILELSDPSRPGSPRRVAADALGAAAVHGWRHDPVFRGLFHETGVVCAASSAEGRAALAGYGALAGWEAVDSAREFRGCMPAGVLTGEFPGWSGWVKEKGSGCGWVEARRAMERARREAERLGVVFTAGERGRVVSLIYEGGDVRGAVVAEGPAHRADRVVVCLGAGAAGVLDVQAQLRPTAWTLAHIRLTPAERELYRDLPVLFNVERGFFMEPDRASGEMKICDEHPGYCNWETSPDDGGGGGRQTSVPFAHHQIPREAEDRVRLFLRETMPHLAGRPLVFARICWCADTPDRLFLISRHPQYQSLVLGVGGSGHGFSYIPAIGGVIADCLEDKMDPVMGELYRWRPETAVGRDWTAKQDRHGPPGSNHVMDFQKVKEWTNIEQSS